MPSLRAEFCHQVTEAMKLAEIGEVARVEAIAGSQTRRDLHHSRVALLYELAFLRMFLAWESFLEQTFLRYLCGYTSPHSAVVLLPGAAFMPTLAQAEVTILAGKDYILWHNMSSVVRRSQRYFTSCPIETVILSNTARLEALAAVRHRIAHAQSDARRKFDLATMAISGKRYRGARPGAFLRDWDTSMAPQSRWLERLGQELQGLAAQIA